MADETHSGSTFPEIVVAGMYGNDNAARGLGVEVVAASPGSACVRMTVREDMLNSHGTCHGGMIFALADTAFAYSCNTDNKTTVAMNCSISFVSPGRRGEILTALSKERVREGRNGIYDVTVSGDDGRTVAVFQGTARQVRGESVPGLDTRLPEAEA